MTSLLQTFSGPYTGMGGLDPVPATCDKLGFGLDEPVPAGDRPPGIPHGRAEAVYLEGPLTVTRFFHAVALPAGAVATAPPCRCLFVGSGSGSASVYYDVDVHGLSAPLALPGCDAYDSVLCVAVSDVTLNGFNDVVVGTFGGQLMVYSFEVGGRLPTLRCVWQRRMDHAVTSVVMADVDADGVKEVVATTTFATTIFKVSPEAIAAAAAEALGAAGVPP